MKISLVTDGIYPYVLGGMQKHSYFLAKYLAQKEINVDLYHYTEGELAKAESPFSIEELKFLNIIEIEYPRSRNFPGHYLYERYLYSEKVYEAITQRELPDFFYVKGFSGWALLKNKQNLKSKIPIGVNFHGFEMFQQWPDLRTGLKLQILKLPVKYNISKADYAFSYGGKISKVINRISSTSRIVEIATGIGASWLVSSLNPTPKEKRKFIFVGRAERRKGIIEINHFLSSNETKDFEFHFVGPISEGNKIKKVNVFYHGAIREEVELKRILDQMDVLVCPSYSEGMPNVILEGMARGLAILATNVGAVNQMVDSSNGWLISEKKISSGIRSAFIDVINLSDLELSGKKQRSLEKVRENFTWEKVINKTIKEIQLCLNF